MPNIASFVPIYLENSQTFIYRYLKYIENQKITNLVFVEDTKNLNLFPLQSKLFVLQDFIKKSNLIKKIYFNFLKFQFRQYEIFEPELKNQKITAIHAHFGSTGHLVQSVAKKLKIPLYISFYGMDLYCLRGPFFDPAHHKLFKQAHRFFVEGPFMKAKLTSLGCPGSKIELLKISVDLNQYRFKARHWLKGREPLQILFCGRFVEKKGIIYAVQAFIRAYKIYPEMKLTLLGGFDYSIQKIIDEALLSHAIIQIEAVPFETFLNYMDNAHVFLSPSVTAKNGDSEGGAPTTILDAQASGLPVISSLHADIPFITQKDESAFLAPEKDVDALAEFILKFVEEPDLISKMGKKGREFVEKNHDIKKIGQKLLSSYQH